MVYSGPATRNRLLRTRQYTASPGWTSTVGWGSYGSGHKLVDSHPAAGSDIKETVCVVVGEVSDSRLAVEPWGNHGAYNTLASSKFGLTLVKPSDVDFRSDWDRSITAITTLQGLIATSQDHKFFVLAEGVNSSLRFTAPIFTLKDPAFDPPGSELDTNAWPVRANEREALADLVQTHKVLPLMVYDETEAAVLPMNVTETIKGALVELTFRLKHYYIQDKNYDTFSAAIEQIIVLKRAPPKQPSPYRRGAGPVRLPTTGPTRSEQVAAVSVFYPPVPTGSAPVQLNPTLGVATPTIQAIASKGAVGTERIPIAEQAPVSPLQSPLPIRGPNDQFTPWPPNTPPRRSDGSSTASSEPYSEFTTPQTPKTPSPSGPTQQSALPQNAAAGPSNLRSGHTMVNDGKRKAGPGDEDGSNAKKGRTGV
ncbi:uncharacterized protein LACBIDRAFT_307571 [Laccaria bicolor S238N-H82]|uniref:Predicted protein n=1 Tax=Laccaria bicolor (strain S238N-H82 / ATCC MYA-4686) TaxID=486041 RepID=B0DQG5_LACBS|nr:uncharacterized protein LACBIDRAFT_307571 [Laccaria bicolor S238N-H82]EDR03105.1 predicted protein [Laccaria bicolor S238N-H82]|eukprot:XP_001886246.1 predicted protein [Laccaria bicolor S238N-H82]